MDSIFDQWKKALQQFNDNMEKELEEVRKCKSQMQKMRSDLEGFMTGVRFIRDDHRLILSAPEIVIGNVDMNGDLWGSQGSMITIRGNHVNVEGVGRGNQIGGTITNKASIIRNIAVDPGQDGKEEVVLPTSQIINQARNISLYSSDENDTFTTAPITSAAGVFIHSDAIFELEAATSVEGKLKIIEEQVKDLEEQKTAQKSQVDASKKTFENQLKAMEAIAEVAAGLDDDIQDIRSNVADLIDKQETQEIIAENLLSACIQYASSMSQYAEINRKITSLKEQQEALNGRKANFKEEPTGALLNMKAENINVSTYDGDGNLRVNPGAGINIQSPVLNVNAHDNEGKLIPDGAVRLQAETVQIVTNDVKYKDPEKMTDADVEAAGNIQLLSKSIVMASMDHEIKDGKAEEKGLAAEGAIVMRAETIQAGAIDKEGKAAGKLSLNAKEVEIKAIDVKREEGKPDEDDKLAAGGSLLITAEKIMAGSPAKDNVTKTVQLSAESVGLFADKTIEMQQGEGDAAINLEGGNASLGGGKVEVFGDTTVNGLADIKGELKVPKATADQVEVKSAFKSPNINDTMGAGVAGQAKKISAKLKREENKKK